MGRSSTHPRNRYAERPPDFAWLASTYPSFAQFVRYDGRGRASINWNDYNATRELTRVLLLNDYGVDWWIPDGHLCPTVTNRANYIHWLEDLLQEWPRPGRKDEDEVVKGLDIGTGTSCIYPLLGASLRGWKFVGTDVTSVALEWAARNVEKNPHLGHLIEIRNAAVREGVEGVKKSSLEKVQGAEEVKVQLESSELREIQRPHGTAERGREFEDSVDRRPIQAAEGLKVELESSEPPEVPELQNSLGTGEDSANVQHSVENTEAIWEEDQCEAPVEALRHKVLLGVVKDDEQFDFCMCNPPFFESMEEAGLNPRTACGGTEEEMLCSGGEAGFISRIIEDSIQVRTRIHWYTTMVGKKSSLKVLSAKLRKVGVTVLRTTEFVQGRTSRWGLAWSFSPASRLPAAVVPRKDLSFMLEGLGKQCNAWDILQILASHLEALGASCLVDKASFSVSVSCPTKELQLAGKRSRSGSDTMVLRTGEDHEEVRFKVCIFQQAPGCLLVKSSLLSTEQVAMTRFVSVMTTAEAALKEQLSSVTRQKTTL